MPVIANGFRGLGIVVLGHLLGSAQAAATDHILYGWIFFAIVILALAAAGLPFRQDHVMAARAPMAVPTPGVGRRAALGGACGAGRGRRWGPVAALALDAGAAAPPASPVLVAAPGCVAMGATGERPAGPVLIQDFACGDARVVTRTEMLAGRANPSKAVRAARGLGHVHGAGP